MPYLNQQNFIRFAREWENEMREWEDISAEKIAKMSKSMKKVAEAMTEMRRVDQDFHEVYFKFNQEYKGKVDSSKNIKLAKTICEEIDDRLKRFRLMRIRLMGMYEVVWVAIENQVFEMLEDRVHHSSKILKVFSEETREALTSLEQQCFILEVDLSFFFVN
jgi:hypothetical protein